MIKVDFGTMPMVDGEGMQNAMWASIMVGGTEYELYAYDPIPEGESNEEGDFLGDSYLRLMAEITEQAEDIGIDPDVLAFAFD